MVHTPHRDKAAGTRRTLELVEASDLVVRDDVLYMRTTHGLRRVHAVLRRLDLDPAHLAATDGEGQTAAPSKRPETAHTH